MEDGNKLSFFELLYGILFQPKKIFRKIAETKPLFYAFLIILGVTLINNTIGFLTATPSDISEMPVELAQFFSVFSSPAFAIIGSLFSTIFTLIFWFFMAATLQLVAEFFGGKGKGLEVMTVLGCATLPQIITVPFTVLVYLLNLPSGILILVSLPIFIYSQIILPVLGLREVHQFSLGKALLTILMPLIFGFAFIIFIIMGIVTMVITFLG